ncbi:MAG: Tll0287-like domain-containing protein [Cellvibrionaceae bacterium]
MSAIKNKGTIGALNFCHINAISITNESIKSNLVTIKRVSDLNRNPKNSADTKEIRFIYEARKLLEDNKKIPPKTIHQKNSTIAYFPIITNNMCLQCHGSAETDIRDNVYRKIQALYPEDKAVGYRENQLRGIWVVRMTNEK